MNPSEYRMVLSNSDIEFLAGYKLLNHDKQLKQMILDKDSRKRVKKLVKNKISYWLAQLIMEECEDLFREGKETESRALVEENLKFLNIWMPENVAYLYQDLDHVPIDKRVFY